MMPTTSIADSTVTRDGQDMAEHDPPVGCSEGLRGGDELPPSEREGLTAHEQRDARPRQQSDDGDKGQGAGTEPGGDEQEEEEPRNRIERRNDELKEIVQPRANMTTG